jgi:hypothetical protein
VATKKLQEITMLAEEFLALSQSSCFLIGQNSVIAMEGLRV